MILSVHYQKPKTHTTAPSLLCVCVLLPHCPPPPPTGAGGALRLLRHPHADDRAAPRAPAHGAALWTGRCPRRQAPHTWAPAGGPCPQIG